MEASSPNTAERRWWTSKDGQAHVTVFALAKFLRRLQKDRRRANQLHMRIVANDDPSGRGNEKTPQERASAVLTANGTERTRYMLCLSIVDTACSIISSSKPTLQILTQAGDWELQRKAKKRTLALSGQMRDLKVEELAPKCFRDACVQDVGSVYGYVHPETGKVRLEHVHPNEILVDHNEALHSEPRNRYRTYAVDRERLKELYPKFAKLIEQAEGIGQDDRSDFFLSRESAADSVLVVEGWHLGSAKKDAKPGRHVMCVSTATLVDEDYKHQEFPFADIKYADMPVGWHGQSLVSRTKEAQRRVNKLIRHYETCQNLMSRPVIFVPRASGLSPEQMTNLPGEAIPTNDDKPSMQMWQGTPPDLRQEIPMIREETLQNEGLSEQQVQGEMMSGVHSAVGIRAADDVQARRHVHPQRRYERFHLDIARLIARCNDDATDADSKYSVTSQSKRGRRDYINSIPWRDVQLEESDARLQVFPTSSLSTTPKGRRDDVMGLLQAGLISQESAIDLLDLPDIDAETADQLAEVDYARWQVERVMDGDDVVIDPILGVKGLSMALDTARKRYLQCSIVEAPEEVLDRLRDYMEDVDRAIKALEPAPAQPTADASPPAGPDSGAQPPAAPAAPLPPMTPQAGPMGVA